MKKQGFTLIELMVVIVIMGILAAVAVPKLFGMIAKSKASEIGPAAGEYIKLQDAYVSETGVYYGGWKKIGYTMSSNTVFEYSGAVGESATVSIGTATEKAWSAKAVAALNDCKAGSEWKIKVSGNVDNGGTVKYDATYSDETNCDPLTASFKKLSR